MSRETKETRTVSIKDVARAANVSHPTVSRALRSSPLVNSETAQRIREVADSMGYRANAVARGLVTRKTWTLGAVVTTVADPFIGEVVSGVDELASDNGYSVFLANCNADPDRELRVVRLFQERRVDGIIVLSSRVGALYMPLLRELKVPIVLINSHQPGTFAHSVMIDNLDASLTAVQYLIQLGHRRIAYVGDQFGLLSDTERFAGYRQALALADCPFLPELVVHGDGKSEGGKMAMARLLELPAPPTAAFCYNDLTAVGALRAARIHGLRVPGDLSVVGFDDLPIASYTEPPLTTVRQPKQQMGRLAVEILCKLLAGAHEQTQIKVPGELIVRESSAAPAFPELRPRPFLRT